MDCFDYSIDAKNILDVFYDVDAVVYVEGDDDIRFWEIIFSEMICKKVEIQAVGGKPELLKYIEEIHDNEARFFIAMDTDYDIFIKENSCNRILRTYGYSIENTLITEESIGKSLRNILRIPAKEDPKRIYKKWLIDFENKTSKAIACDILNQKEGMGLRVLPSSCNKIMKGRSPNICEISINSVTDKIISEFDEELLKIEKQIRKMEMRHKDVIRGHLLFSSTLRFIQATSKKSGKAIKISSDMFYSLLISIFESSFDENHEHYAHYEEVTKPLQ